MADDTYMKVGSNLPRHPKAIFLATQLETTLQDAVAKLIWIWSWAQTYAEDGDLSKHDPAVIATAAEYAGKPEDFVKALIASGWMDANYRLHKWEKWAGAMIAGRAMRREKMRGYRARPDEEIAAPVTTPVERKRRVTPTRMSRDSHVAVTLSRAKSLESRVENLEIQNPTDSEIAVATQIVLLDSSPLAIAPRTRRRDEIWDAFTDVLGEALTSREQSRRGKVVKELREAGITAQQVELALRNWSNVMGAMTCTETGILSHIGKLTQGFQTAGRSAGVVLEHRKRVTETGTIQRARSLSDIMAERRSDGDASRDF